MLDACLPATGPETWVIALLVAVGTALLIAGAIFVARSKARMALLLVPVAALALVLAAPAQSSQAVATAVPGFTVEGHFVESLAGYSFVPDDPYTTDQQAALDQLDDILSTVSGATSAYSIELQGDGEGQSGSLDPDANLSWEAGYPSVDAVPVNDLISDWDNPILMTVTWTVSYPDDCGKPLQTVVVWTGNLSFPT